MTIIKLAIIGSLVACSTPSTWKPPQSAETVRIEGDLIVRAEGDESISVTARVANGSASASGFVFLRSSNFATAAQSQHVRLARARAWQTLAAMLAADPAGAFEAAKKGLEEIADGVGSDRSEVVSRAERAHANNDLREAAREMMIALRERLRGYVTEFQADVR